MIILTRNNLKGALWLRAVEACIEEDQNRNLNGLLRLRMEGWQRPQVETKSILLAKR